MRAIGSLLLVASLIFVGALDSQVAGPTSAPNSTTTAVSTSAGSVLNFPRLASLYAYYSSAQAITYARYGLVVAPPYAGPSGAVLSLKRQSPKSKVVFYLDSSAVDVPGFDGMSIYPGWWLTLAGTRLAAPLDATSTSVQVVNASVIDAELSTNPDVLVDGETMHVLSVNTSTNTLTVQRGYDSTAAPHAAGARLAAHATNWPNVWMLNITPYCPTDPATGLTWARYLAQQARKYMATGPWDGVYFDNANASWADLSGGQLDADNDNIPDAGNGPSGTGWQDGEINLFKLARSALGGALILANGGTYPSYLNGREMEHFPSYDGGLANGFNIYKLLTGPGVATPTTILNADANNSDAQNLQSMRFNLGLALMGNGYYAYDYGAQNHGQTWWYDEYDDGAGSSLRGAIDATQTTLALAPGTGPRFKVGDEVQVPDAATVHDDEQMLVTGIRGDTLTVHRGYADSEATPHPSLSKVFTLAQLAAGLGWLGQPLGGPTSIAQLGQTLTANGDFDQRGSTWLAPWTFSVVAPAAARISQDNLAADGGRASARIAVTIPSPGTPWNVALAQQSLKLVAGAGYTLTFWARGSAGQIVQAIVQQQASPWTDRSSQTYTLANTWQQYSMTFTAPVTESDIKLQFNVAQAAGTVWIEDVRFCTGDADFWRRDFTHGTVLVNATNSAQTVTLGPGYRRIAGTQDPLTNNGAAVRTVTIAPRDALLLVKDAH